MRTREYGERSAHGTPDCKRGTHSQRSGERANAVLKLPRPASFSNADESADRRGDRISITVDTTRAKPEQNSKQFDGEE